MSGFVQSIADTASFVLDSNSKNDTDSTQKHHPLDVSMDKLLKMLRDPAFTLSDLPAYIDAVQHLNSGIDDRKMLLEKALVLLSRLGDSEFSINLQKHVIDLLYTDLPHPPASYLSMESTPTQATSSSFAPRRFTYRTADGSNYNPQFPRIGQAGTPYARSVPGTNYTPIRSLPDAGCVFDTLLRRPEGEMEDKDHPHFADHPGGLSSLFFAFADLIIHSIFNTSMDPKNPNLNMTSSYLDLSILYGNSEKDNNSVRLDEKDRGMGKIHNDSFADFRLLFMPPSTCALLVVLSRNHNYIAEQIFRINENGGYSEPKTLAAEKRLEQDEEIFQRARLVNCAQFMRIILGDYVGAILGLTRDGYSWRLNPLMPMRHLSHELSPRGEGNTCSIEFNLLYRWHATLSRQDTEWTEQEFAKLFGGMTFDSITPEIFHEKLKGKFGDLKKIGPPQNWTFHDLKRNRDGKFDDADIAKILQNATSWRAGAFRAKGIPAVLRVVEILAIESARKWGACSMNEFREFMGLKKFEKFEDWNPDPTVAKAAKALYKDINNLELHVGLQAEAAKTPQPGAALCPGYTMSRAILADAVCLTRGDRFLTVDFTPYNLTSWGFKDSQYDPEDGSYGGMLTKVLLRALPGCYPEKSAYAYFPFLHPDTLKKELEQRGEKKVLERYAWNQPRLPGKKCSTFDQPQPADLTAVFPGPGQPLHFDSRSQRRLDEITGADPVYVGVVRDALAKENPTKWAEWLSKKTAEMIDEMSVDHLGKQPVKYLDVVKDVLNLLPVLWFADIAGVSLRASKTKGTHTAGELYESFTEVAQFVYLDFDMICEFRHREVSKRTFNDLVIGALKPQVDKRSGGISRASSSTSGPGFIENLVSEFKKTDQGYTSEDIAASLFAEIVPSLPLYSKVLSLLVDYYLDEDHTPERGALISAAGQKSAQGDQKVMELVGEVLTKAPVVSYMRKISTKDQLLCGVALRRNDDVNIGLPEDYRGVEKTDFGLHGLFLKPLYNSAVPRILHTILSLPDIARAPGSSGQFNAFSQVIEKNLTERMFITSEGSVTPFPESLMIQHTKPKIASLS